MPSPARLLVEILRLPAMQPPQAGTQRVCPFRHGDQMHGVRHSAPRQFRTAVSARFAEEVGDMSGKFDSSKNVVRRSTPRCVTWQGTPGRGHRVRLGIRSAYRQTKPYEEKKLRSSVPPVLFPTPQAALLFGWLLSSGTAPTNTTEGQERNALSDRQEHNQHDARPPGNRVHVGL